MKPREDYPLVSVQVQTFNSANYIKETLDSVVSQDYPNFEVVIADDASTDETPAILKTYQQNYPHIIKLIINKENQGITRNSNIVLNACRGKYLALIGGDDIMLPGKLSAQVSVMEEKPECVISQHDVEAFDDTNGQLLWKKSDRYITTGLNLEKLLKNGNQLISCEVMIRRSAIPPHGYNTYFPVVSDFVLFFEVLANHPHGTIEYVDKIYSRYRIRSNSALRSRETACWFDTLNFLNWCILFYPQYLDLAACHYAKTLDSIPIRENSALCGFIRKKSLCMHFTRKRVLNYLRFLLKPLKSKIRLIRVKRFR